MQSRADAPVIRLAMWSGPRNISTAMMRAWGNRPDTAVIDEPLYAHFLFTTHRNHAGRDEVIAAGPTDLAQAVATLLGPVPDGKPIFYQKHMTHHLLPGMDRSWIAGLTNCFLIRSPTEVLTSLVKHVPDLTVADTGFPQQAEIFEMVRKWTGQIPPVIDAADVLRDPRGTLTMIACTRIAWLPEASGVALICDDAWASRPMLAAFEFEDRTHGRDGHATGHPPQMGVTPEASVLSIRLEPRPPSGNNP